MPAAGVIKVEVGYSNVPERSYALDAHVKLPTAEFLSKEIYLDHKEQQELFASWCRHYSLSPNSTVTFPWWVDFLKCPSKSVVANDKKLRRELFVVTRAQTIQFIRLREAIKKAARVVSHGAASITPPVTFHYISGKNKAEASINVHVKASNESVLARVVQGDLKDSLHAHLTVSKRPILDLGGGEKNLAKALKKGGDSLSKVVTYDKVVDYKMTFKDLDLDEFKDHTVHVGHASYHFEPAKWVEVVRRNPKGITLVIDGSEAEVHVQGDDYDFHAFRIQSLEVEAYRVHGTLFGLKGDQKKARVFKDEIWYSRKQWVEWKFDLFSLPGCHSAFVKRHVVLFTRGETYPPRISKQVPVNVYLGEGQLMALNRKQPKLYKLFEEARRDEDMACLYGQPFYQCPKLDGIGMTLTTDKHGKLYLTDRMGISYSVSTSSGHKFFSYGQNIQAAVEICPNVSPPGSYKMYLSQVVRGFGEKYISFAKELVSFQLNFNEGMKGELVLGRKEYWLTRNMVLDWNTTMPSDGVVYVPAIATSTWLDPMRYPLHSYVKPFESTDTSPYIIANEQTRINVAGVTNEGSTVIDVLYRSDGFDFYGRVSS